MLYGGIGHDVFIFSTSLSIFNVDRIMDFDASQDRIALGRAVFSNLTPGALDPAAL